MVPPQASHDYDYLEALNDYIWDVAEAIGATFDVQLVDTCEGREFVVTVDEKHFNAMKFAVEGMAHDEAMSRLRSPAQPAPGNQNG